MTLPSNDALTIASRRLLDSFKHQETVYLSVRVVPGAARSEVQEVMADGAWKIYLKAKPVKGRANDELIKLIAAYLKINPHRVTIISGHASRCKLLRLTIQ